MTRPWFAVAALAFALGVGCNLTVAPPPARTLAPTARPQITPPPPPSDLPAEIQLPRIPLANTVYDLGKCTGSVPASSPDRFLILAYAYTLQSKPISGVELSGDTFASVKTDDKGAVQVSVPASTKTVAITSGDKILPSPVSAKVGECRVLVAYFG